MRWLLSPDDTAAPPLLVRRTPASSVVESRATPVSVIPPTVRLVPLWLAPVKVAVTCAPLRLEGRSASAGRYS